MFSKYLVNAAVIPDCTAPFANVAHVVRVEITPCEKKKGQGFCVINEINDVL